MAWEQLAITKPHLVYLILGGFTSLFMLCSSVIKERLYIGEATVATLCGIIFGPHAANLINPLSWGNTDLITLEFARIVLVVQCFAVGVELPKSYMERHWRSVTFLLVPVMTFGWLITSLFVWWMFGGRLNWLDSLCVAACVTATDPVLASSVVGKGKFAKRVPKHLRDLLSAESGCNDGMAFPFIYLAIYLIRYRPDANAVSFHWFCYTILYECIFGAFFGVCVGYAARRAIRFAHEHDLIDRESFLVFYFVLALFCAGAGSLLGMDDLLIGFAAGVGFSNDGWFTEKTEEAHVSNVIDLLINLAFFVYFGTIIPWEQYNSAIIGTSPWRLVVLGILVLFFRRIPAMLALKPLIPDIKTWREALFAGHFGPIGVGALFVAILARAEFETDSTTPLSELPEPGFSHLNIIELIWPITTFLVICSIVVHGSSIAVFTLGKHINTLTLTLSYTTANEEGPSWMDRLPRIQSRSKSSMSMRRPGLDETDSSIDEKGEFAPGELPPIGLRGQFLRRQKEEDAGSRASSIKPSKRRKWDAGLGPGGPISQSAIAPQHRNRDHADVPSPAQRDSDTIAVNEDESPESSQAREMSPQAPEEEIYQEGKNTVFEDEEGNVLGVRESHGESPEKRRESEIAEGRRLMREKVVEGGVAQKEHDSHADEGEKVAHAMKEAKETAEHPGHSWKESLKRMEHVGALKRRHTESAAVGPSKAAQGKDKERKRGPALAYQFGNTIIVEDEDGEVLKKYDIPAPKRPGADRSTTDGKTRQRLQRMGTYLGLGHDNSSDIEAGPSTDKKKKKQEIDPDDDRIRFTVTAGGRRMSKAEFIQQIQKLDPKSRAALVEDSNVPESVKEEARQDAEDHASRKRIATAVEPSKDADPRMLAQTDGADAALERVSSSEERPRGPEGLTLVDSNEEDIPFHSLSGDLAAYAGSGKETAAQRRRRLANEAQGRSPLAAESAEEERRGRSGSPADMASRSPGTVGRSKLPVSHMDEGETAAERRRREGALGISKGEDSESSSSDDEDDQGTGLREPPPVRHRERHGDEGGEGTRTPGIRFADSPRPSMGREQGAGQATGGGHRLRWGRDVGKKGRS